MRALPFCLPLLLLAGCAGGDDRRLDRDEVLLQISATGRADTRPDEARLTLGVETQAASAEAASRQNAERTEAAVEALRALGIAEDDLRTRALTLRRIDYGPERGRYQASNLIDVRVRDVARAGEAVGAATTAGANVLSGPDLRVADPESAARAAYANAFRAARARADAYAEAAGLRVVRTLAIRDGEGEGAQPYHVYASPAAPPPVVQTVAPPVLPGAGEDVVRVRVDFALAQ